MALTKKAGAALQTGVDEISGMIAQQSAKGAGGELREYYDEDGNVYSVYLFDDHETISFEGLLESTGTMKAKGDTITFGDATYYITDWQIQYTNNDVAKVSGSARTYPDLSSGGNS